MKRKSVTMDDVAERAQVSRQQGYKVFICGSEAGELGEPLGSPLLNSQRAEGVLILYRGSSRDHHRLLGVCRP
jgi:DNA-binding LacI/PurR family transcriptional regulator